MLLDLLIETVGDDWAILLAGALVGLVFGIAAQRSAFCLRASTIELAQGRIGQRMAVWLVAFSAALAGTQGAILLGWLDVADARQLSGVGSLSGAILGGGMFGIGMVLARGCASRLLILSATGNLRALITGLVLTLVAQSSLRGILAPARESLSGLWTITGPARDMGQGLGVSTPVITLAALAMLAVALGIARYRQLRWTKMFAATVVGLSVALGWVVTYTLAQVSFNVVPVASITFTGPATDTLMAFVSDRSVPFSFGLGLVPGVFLGAAMAAIVSREWHIERFGADTPMERYLAGAVLMGFGAMLAGGCAVGSAMSGGAVLALTAWVAALSIWAGGVGTALLLDRLGKIQPAAVT